MRKGVANARKPGKPLDLADRVNIVNLGNNGYKPAGIARMYFVSTSTIRRIMKGINIDEYIRCIRKQHRPDEKNSCMQFEDQTILERKVGPAA